MMDMVRESLKVIKTKAGPDNYNADQQNKWDLKRKEITGRTFFS